jgi:succinate dehydrogenase/fumarate reductase flavoprotein subunit
MVSLIYKELAEGRGTGHGGVFLDVSESPLSGDALRDSLMAFLPEKYSYLLKYGVDIARQRLEVAPMAHYTLGGIKINADCETAVRGLFAAGEVEGNVHGANRLAGNALPETQVFGAKAGEKSSQWAKENDFVPLIPGELGIEVERVEAFIQPKRNSLTPSVRMAELQDTMWKYLGINRDSRGIQKAVAEIERMKLEDLPRVVAPSIRKFNVSWVEALEFSNMLDICALVAQSALMREETRGHHFRIDFPDRDDENWLKHILIKKVGKDMRLWTEDADQKK